MVAENVSDTIVSTTESTTTSKVVTFHDPNVVPKALSDKILTQKLEDLQSNIDTLTTLCTILCVILLFFFVIQALAVVIQLIRRCGQKKLEDEMAKKSEKSDKSSKKTKSSKKSKKGKSKKSKSKKSKTNSSKSKTSKKSAEKKKQQPQKLPSSKLSAAEKKPENSGSKKLEASDGSGKKSSAEQQPLPPSLIQSQPQDPLLSLSNGNVSSQKPTTAQIEKEFKYMNNLEAGKLQTLPLPSVIAAAIDPAKHVPEATTPPQPSKTADSMKDNKTDETSASLKYEKQFPDVTTPPQVRSPKKNEKDEVKIDGMPSGPAESIRKVADVSSPPPLIPESKSNTDSLMLPVSTPPMTPVQLGSLQISTPPLAPPIFPQQPTTSVQSGSLQPLPTIPKAPINKLDDPQTKN